MELEEKLRILLLEDRHEDVEIIKRELKSKGFSCVIKHVEDKDGFISELKKFRPDLILSDYNLPSFNGLDALNFVVERKIDLPFIFVTGSINEETAVECIKKGATDYVIKENLKRLIPSIENALEKFNSKREKIKVQNALLKTEEKFSHAFNYANIGMCMVDLNGNFIQTNSKFSELIGYTSCELAKKSVYEITFSKDIDITKSFYSDFIGKGNESAELEKRYIHKNGNIVWVFMSISLVNKQDDSPDFFIAHIQDITQKKADEELIRKLSKSVEQSPVMVIITDLNGKTEYVNSKFEEITGYTLNEVKTKHPKILSSEYQDQTFYKNLWETIEAGKIWTGEFVNKKKNGEEYWESASISAINDRNNKPTHYLAIKQDVTAQKLMERALIIAKEKAEESDRLKSAFLANVSHEIRTPMNGILGFSELLEEDNVSQDRQHEYIKIIRKSGHQLLGIVSDILDISKLESGQLRITKDVFSVYDLFHESLLVFDDRINKSKKSIHIELIAPSDESNFIKTDRLRLTQILQNLLSNAEKFTEKGSIKFGYEISSDLLHVFVSDTGKGIESENMEAIFDRFRQEDEAISKAFGGTGLGLSISKGLVKLLGGEISAKSEIGVGSTFSFFIKIESSTETPLSGLENYSDNKKFNGETILIVEDVQENYDLLYEYLTKRNLKVIRAETGIKGIEICTIRKEIKLVLMDIKLPDINGYDATMAIKKIKAHLPIVAQTAYAMENEKQKCLDAGCDDYLSKPIQFKKLNEILAKYVN